MATETEEIQAKEFLKRAEIRTMRKDLQSLREVDALQERDKIAKIKTLEELQAEEKKQLQVKEAAKNMAEKNAVGNVLKKNEGQEKIAEKDLKSYATEQERQQIFLLESQRFDLERQIDAIDKEKDPTLKLEKNKLLIQKRDQQIKLDAILEEEKKLEGEQKVITDKEQKTTVAAEKKSLETTRWDLDKKIQDVEKKRWEAEKQIEDTDKKIGQIDESSGQNVIEKNGLRDKVLGVDKSLREIYSAVMVREEEKRSGQAQEQVAKREALSKIRADENEKVQRQQWSGAAAKKSGVGLPGFLDKAPQSVKEKLKKSFEAEEQQRKNFLRDVESQTQNKGKQQLKQETVIPPVVPTRSTTAPEAPIPPRKTQQ